MAAKKNSGNQYTSNVYQTDSNGLTEKVELHDTAIQLINQKFDFTFTAMTKGIDQLNTNIKDLQLSIKNGFVTKEEHLNLQKRVDDMDSVKKWLILFVAGSIIKAILDTIGLKLV